MLESTLRMLEDYEPTISSIVGLLTLCAAIWGVVRLGIMPHRRRAAEAVALSTVSSGVPSSAWQSLFNLGLSEHSQLEELVSVRTVNVVLFCLLIVSFPWLLACLLFIDSAVLALVNLVVFSGSVLGFALQSAGATTAARWLVILIVAIYWLGALVTVGGMYGTEYFIAGLLSLPVLILSRAQTVQRLLSIAFIAAVFALGLALTMDQPPHMALDEGTLTFGYYVNALTLAAIIFASVSYYKRFAASSYQVLSSKKKQNDALVSKLMPSDLAKQMVNQETMAAQWHPEGTVLVGTLTGFSNLYSRLPAIDLVAKLDELYSRFDELMEAHGLEKVKSLGTTYVAAAGLNRDGGGYTSVASAALAMRTLVGEFAREQDLPIGFRCGVATGLTISGVIGKSRPRFDIWGEALDTAALLGTSAEDGEVWTNETAYWRLGKHFAFSSAAEGQAPFKLLKQLEAHELVP